MWQAGHLPGPWNGGLQTIQRLFLLAKLPGGSVLIHPLPYMGKATQLKVSYADTASVHSPSTEVGFALISHMMHSIVVAYLLREQIGI